MKRMFAIFSALVVSLGMSLSFAPSASAASHNQSYCNSDYSWDQIRVGATTIDEGDCKTVGKFATVHLLNTQSYEVQYYINGSWGSWSVCRSNNNFDAWNTPTKLRFKTFAGYRCVAN